MDNEKNVPLLKLSKLGQEWADSDNDDQLKGAIKALNAIGRYDYADVLGLVWLEHREQRGLETRIGPRKGKRCPHDGGTCHHHCTDTCFRMEVGASLTKPWPGFPVKGKAPVEADDDS